MGKLWWETGRRHRCSKHARAGVRGFFILLLESSTAQVLMALFLNTSQTTYCVILGFFIFSQFIHIQNGDNS